MILDKNFGGKMNILKTLFNFLVNDFLGNPIMLIGFLVALGYILRKETKNKTSFPLFMIHPHQIKHLKKVVFHGGIGFFIIRFNYHNETYLVDSKMLIDKIENIDKSSIPYTWFQNHGTLIQEGLYPRLAYLKAVDELYFKEDK